MRKKTAVILGLGVLGGSILATFFMNASYRMKKAMAKKRLVEKLEPLAKRDCIRFEIEGEIH